MRAPDYAKLPLSFEANQGQSDSRVKFVSRGNGYSLFLTNRGAVLSLTKGDRAAHDKPFPGMRGSRRPAVPPKTDVVRMELAGSTQGARVTGTDQLPGFANYFIGNDPAKWHINVPTYAKVKYEGVYKGIDLVYYGNHRQLEYDFVVAPGADPSQVRLHFTGAGALRISPAGDLIVVAKHGEVAFHKPVVYQVENGRRQLVDTHFELLPARSAGFAVSSYDHARQLVIDPTLEYSTYLGAAGPDDATGIAVDAGGNAYVTGYTYSKEFPTTSGAYQASSAYTTNTGKSAVFISKLNAAGTELVYSTYLSGTEDHCTAGTNYNALTQGDFGTAIALDSSGNAFITGGTCANDFPTTASAFQTVDTGAGHHATNAFITKLNTIGSALIYSTYLGGQGAYYSGDWANAIALDASGDAYVTGQTSSPNFPTTKGAYLVSNPNAYGKNSAFITKVNPTGTALVYSTYLGGSGNTSGSIPGDSGSGIAVNAAGNAYVTGYAYSSNFPTTTGAYQTTNKAAAAGGSSPFITEMNAAGTALVYSTYLDGTPPTGNFQDSGNAIALDASGNVYIAGETWATNFPTTSGAYQIKFPETGSLPSGFVTKLNAAGTTLVYSTYLGGAGDATSSLGDGMEAIALDPLGNVYLTGFTGSSNFPVTTGAYQTTNKAAANHAQTAFVSELNSSGTGLLYSTYFGGSGTTANTSGDIGNAVSLSSGNLYVAGATESTNFPVTTGAYQKTNEATAGNTTAFIARFAVATATTTTLVSDDNPQKLGGRVTFTATVTPTEDSGTPTGTVGFSIDGGAAVQVNLDDTGHAAYATNTLTAGTHTVKATYSGDATHLASTSATLTQTIYGAASSLTVVSGSGQSSSYGSAYKLPLVVLVKDAKGDLVPGLTVTFNGTGLTFSPASAITGSNGEVSVTATPTTLGALTATASTTGATSVSFSLSSSKAALTVTATNASVTYNQPIPALAYAIKGFVNGDTSKVVTGAPGETTTAIKGSAPGAYPITLTQGTLAATNYSFTLVNGTLTVTPLGITATPGVTQVVTIAEATTGATVYYTTNGTTPTTSSTKYTGPIALTAGATLKFIAVTPGYTNSAVRTVTDTVQ